VSLNPFEFDFFFVLPESNLGPAINYYFRAAL